MRFSFHEPRWRRAIGAAAAALCLLVCSCANPETGTGEATVAAGPATEPPAPQETSPAETSEATEDTAEELSADEMGLRAARKALIDGMQNGDVAAVTALLDPSSDLMVFHPFVDNRFDGIIEVETCDKPETVIQAIREALGV